MLNYTREVKNEIPATFIRKRGIQNWSDTIQLNDRGSVSCFLPADWSPWTSSSWNGCMRKSTSSPWSPKQTPWPQRNANSSRNRSAVSPAAHMCTKTALSVLTKMFNKRQTQGKESCLLSRLLVQSVHCVCVSGILSLSWVWIQVQDRKHLFFSFHWLCLKLLKVPLVLHQIMREIQEHKIKIYEFPETDDEEENRLVKKIKVLHVARLRPDVLGLLVYSWLSADRWTGQPVVHSVEG